MRNLLALVVVGLIVYTVIDVTRSDERERLGLHKVLWVAFMVLVPVLGSVTWLLVRRTPGRRTGRGPGLGTVPQAPLAPDDDPEFLWRLEQERRRREREAGGTGAGEPADPTDPTQPPSGPSSSS
ncbi:PLDc N-terminal domain-containing protein [Cellulomonas sp. 179-A 4D5 NHS]|uniref:PLDc N-terminal domain-containing protein n=1 Tax=Cellulomonas sp. 179-A 4D5 NHS TaxID=3142378 RepID=UPI0039A22335